jgi:chromatin remodeling complex protein RSC6
MAPYVLTKLYLVIMTVFLKKLCSFQFSKNVEVSEAENNTVNTAEDEEEEEEEEEEAEKDAAEAENAEEEIADFVVAYATSSATSLTSCKH